MNGVGKSVLDTFSYCGNDKLISRIVKGKDALENSYSLVSKVYFLKGSMTANIAVCLLQRKVYFSAGMNRRYLESGLNLPGKGLMLRRPAGKMNLILVEA
jgi:hypothetical protein